MLLVVVGCCIYNLHCNCVVTQRWTLFRLMAMFWRRLFQGTRLTFLTCVISSGMIGVGALIHHNSWSSDAIWDDILVHTMMSEVYCVK
jgi:hypothetical protein